VYLNSIKYKAHKKQTKAKIILLGELNVIYKLIQPILLS